MVDDLSSSAKDVFLTKASKSSTLVGRMAILVFAMVCGVYICSICLKQMSTPTKIGVLDIKVINESCPEPNIEPWEMPYVHYPKPKTYSRAECACNPVRYFALLSMQRSGSGWFETFLNNHTNISSNGEIFSVKARRSNISTIVETLDEVYNLDWLSSASKNECTAAVGLKWMLNQGLMKNHEQIAEYFRKHGVSVIFLFRRNLLRRMISIFANQYDKDAKLLNGTHKSHVHSPHEAETLAKYKPTINSTSLVSELRQVNETTTKALEYFKSTRHIVIYYEDVVKNRTKLVDVQDFLKVPHKDLKSRQVKIHKGLLSNQIENWNDVSKTLNGTAYESFLHADYRK
ncbi:uncharacterized protein LOC129286695 isoform X1 [Prosopis cineraria]|uniref:uncharacterized protein LOC129286695 isoform X1 n=1 Tax=Prosopis cineraria TaxID=364024 RepID=UPI002410B02B|nr:uncharacterized protein LOC129286695 isoform X1 [Prosopis cineraria]